MPDIYLAVAPEELETGNFGLPHDTDSGRETAGFVDNCQMGNFADIVGSSLVIAAEQVDMCMHGRCHHQ